MFVNKRNYIWKIYNKFKETKSALRSVIICYLLFGDDFIYYFIFFLINIGLLSYDIDNREFVYEKMIDERVKSIVIYLFEDKTVL